MQKIFYHVVTEKPMKVGQIITFNNHHHSGVYERVNNMKKIVSDIYNNTQKYENIEFDHHTKVALRELTLEDLRKKEYPNYPSRLESLYVSDSLKEAKEWYDRFKACNRPTFGIAKVTTDGKIFSGDAWNCFDGTKDLNKNIKLAKKYWMNEKNNKNEKPIKEIIINGKIEVVEIIEEKKEEIITNQSKLLFPNYNHSILNTITSILKYYNVETIHSSLPILDEKLKNKYKNIVLIVLDGMGKYILDDLSKNGYFEKNTIDTTTSVYPSTTTAALTTYYSGKTPYETGYVAWSQYFKEYGRQMDMLKQKDSYTGEKYEDVQLNVFKDILQYKTVFEQIEEQGIKAYELMPSYSEKKSKRSFRCDTIEEIIEGIEILENIDEKKFIMGYCDKPDSLIHKYGTDSKEAKQFIESAENQIKEMVPKLKDTIVIISADHGHKNIEKSYNIIDYPELYECLMIPESLESRFISFLVKEEKKDFFEKRFKQLFEKEFYLLTKEELYEKKLLGYGDKHKKLDDFIGNYVAISISSSIFQLKNYFFKGKEIKKSTHCGLTKEEMAVPLIVIEKK